MMPDHANDLTELQRRNSRPIAGTNGPVPVKHMPSLRKAIDIVWRLDTDPALGHAFRGTLAKLSSANLPDEVYANVLNRKVIDCADTSCNGRIQEEFKADQAIAGNILHEAIHPAGAPSAPLGEWDLSRIHQAAGLPR